MAGFVPATRKTELAIEVMDSMRKRREKAREVAFPDTGLVFMEKAPARQRFAQYVIMTDPRDSQLILDPDYLRKYQQRMMPVPVSPFWRSALTLPDTFREMQRDFRILHSRYLRENLNMRGAWESSTNPQAQAGYQ